MNPQTWIVIAVVVALIVALPFIVARLRRHQADLPRALDALDTVVAWTPEATRVMTQHEREAYQTLVQAVPEHIVLAQVPLARFIRVPRRYSYGEWVNRVGRLNADLLVCDKASEVLAVIEIHSPRDSARSRGRHERMTRVLKAAGIRVIVWMESTIPTPAAARAQIVLEPAATDALTAASAKPARAQRGGRLSTELPVAETSEFDAADTQPMRDPAPSTWFDDFDSSPTPLEHGPAPR